MFVTKTLVNKTFVTKTFTTNYYSSPNSTGCTLPTTIGWVGRSVGIFLSKESKQILYKRRKCRKKVWGRQIGIKNLVRLGSRKHTFFALEFDKGKKNGHGKIVHGKNGHAFNEMILIIFKYQYLSARIFAFRYHFIFLLHIPYGHVFHLNLRISFNIHMKLFSSLS